MNIKYLHQILIFHPKRENTELISHKSVSKRNENQIYNFSELKIKSRAKKVE